MKRSASVKAYMKAFASQGGKARAKALSKARRSEIGKLGAAARWKNKILATQR